MAESDQNTLKVGIHSFPAWRSALKRVSVEIGQQVRLLCPWARQLNKVTSLSPGQGTLTYHHPRINKCFKKNQISYRGVKLWNELENKLKVMYWFAFKKQYMKYLQELHWKHRIQLYYWDVAIIISHWFA